MHGSVREELENLLAAKPLAGATKAADHISACSECASELKIMRAQSQLFDTLKPPPSVEPSGGFYARVMQRIEEHARRSIWWVFAYSPIGKRLAFASLALALALGSYVVATETSDRDVTVSRQQGEHYDPPVAGSPEQQREAVLANFVSHSTVSE